MKTVQTKKNQRGAVLVVSLLILLMTTMIAITLMSTSSLDLKMATNQQLHLESQQKAEAIKDDIYAQLDISNDDGYLKAEGDKICTTADAAETVGEGEELVNPECIELTNIALSTAVDNIIATDVELNFYVEQVATKVPAYSLMDAGKAGSENFDLYEIHVEYDAREINQGRSEIAQGVLISYGQGSDQERRETDIDMYRDMGGNTVPTPEPEPEA